MRTGVWASLRRRTACFALILSLAALTACNDDDGTDEEEDVAFNHDTDAADDADDVNGIGGGGDSPPMSLVTYNVGLARGFVDHASSRREPVAQAVANLDADAVCLQEVWLFEDEEGNWRDDDIQLMVDTASGKLPHSHYVITDNTVESAGCTEAEAVPLRQCVVEHCADVEPDQLATCALQNCGDTFGGLSQSCQTCIASNLGKPIDAIMETCVDGRGGMYASGHNGLLLLSRHEITEASHRTLPSSLIQRVVLHARINVPETGEVDLFCTHLAADLSHVIDYPGGEFDSFEEEQAAQIDEMLAWVEERATSGRVVLMGDFNTGPDKGGLTAELPANYQTLVEAGYVSPYIEEQASPPCTFCTENTLTREEANKAIDHVFVRANRGYLVTSVERILDGTTTIETDEGALELHLSDHYGVRVIIRW